MYGHPYADCDDPKPLTPHLAKARRQERQAARVNHQEAWYALLLIRETIETLGPVGCLRSGEDVACNPEHGHFLDEAMELVQGIQLIALTRKA